MDMSARPAVVLTREHEDNLELGDKLRALGVHVREIPCLATKYVDPVAYPHGRADALVFTSKHGVRGWRRLISPDSLPQGFSWELLAAVGPVTADELIVAGMQAQLVADPPEGRVLGRMLVDRLASGSRIVVVCGNLRAGGLDSILEKAGFKLEYVRVYENQEPKIPILRPFPVVAVYVASPSAVKRLVENNPWFKDTLFCSIGPTTTVALAELGVSKIQQVGLGNDKAAEALYRAYECAF